MANLDPSHLLSPRREEELETLHHRVLVEQAHTHDDDDDDDDEEEEEEEEEPPSRVSDSGQGEGEKRRRVEKGGESLWMNATESGDCSHWNGTDIDGLFCSICMDAWTHDGDHHISCLPCGHIYGFSCIKKWLQQRRSSGKCPQCNRVCSLKDVRKLFASRVVAVDEESQKRIQFLEAKCAYLEKKGADCVRCEKQAEWRKREAELDLKIQHLEKECLTLKSQTAEILTCAPKFSHRCGYPGRERPPAPADSHHGDNIRNDEQQAAELSGDGLTRVDELHDIHEEFNTLRHDLSTQVADLSRQVADLRDEFHTFRHEVSEFMRRRRGDQPDDFMRGTQEDQLDDFVRGRQGDP